MRRIGTAVLSLLALGVGSAITLPRPAQAQETEMAKMACINQAGERMPPATRRSPLDSVSFTIADQSVKVCYGRPSARERTIMGGLVPYGQLWRTGANEPTMIHTSVALNIAGLTVEPGTYSLYTVPGEEEWQVIVNRSTSQWGHESRYSAEVEAQEVGRATVPAAETKAHVEQFTIRAEPRQEGNAVLILEWERARVVIPVTAAK